MHVLNPNEIVVADTDAKIKVISLENPKKLSLKQTLVKHTQEIYDFC